MGIHRKVVLRMRQRISPLIAPLLALGSLLLIFLWIYGRFAGRLYFLLDDPIETEAALARPLGAIIGDAFSGRLNWSGYRPGAYSLRAIMAHAFGLQAMAGYFVVGLAVHLANVLLAYRLLWRVGRSVLWAFVAAAIVLLLPSHNEAVLYMSASANLFALLFALLALDFALTARERDALWPQGAAALAYAAAVLVYEVTIILPLLVFAADWALEGRQLPRARWPLYAMLATAVVLVLGMRLWAGSFAPVRSDYATSFAPGHLARGYLLLLGQMVLLHNSPWLHIPPFDWIREWMSPANPRAVASMLLTLGATVAVIVATWRPRRGNPGNPRTLPLPPHARPWHAFWVLWGVLWVLMISLPFAALAGRNPENRYTYIPSFGFAVALVAGLAWGQERLRRRPWARGLLLGAVALLLTFYAYVDTSDVSEYERASAHTRAFFSGAPAALATVPPGVLLMQVGVPGTVGGAFVFTTDESFRSSMRLLYGPQTQSLPGDLALRTRLMEQPDAAAATALLAYDRATGRTAQVEQVMLCSLTTECAAFALLPGKSELPWRYVQVYNEETPEQGGVALLVESANPQQRVACWGFADLERREMTPIHFTNQQLDERCARTAAELHANQVYSAPR